ncbi:hypothetical protein ACLB2K_058299 [Fragaria x ananassa]
MQWLPSPIGHHKINSDASWFPPGHTRIVTVIRDSNRVMIAGSSLLKKCGSVTEAEATAILAGSELATPCNYKISFSSQTQKKSFQKSIRSTTREANRVAHVTASLAFGRVDPLRWASQPPPSLTNVLRNDRLSCPHVEGV